MFPVRFWPTRFFNPRYWFKTGADAFVGSVTHYHTILGSDTASKTILGSDTTSRTILGSDSSSFTLKGPQWL